MGHCNGQQTPSTPRLTNGGGDSQKALAEFAAAGVDTDELAAQLQTSAAKSFVDAWNDLIAHIDQQSAALSAVSG